jgi:hypothetical protein
MGGDEVCLGVGFQHHFEKMTGIEAQDGAAIGGQVADLRQAGVEFPGRVDTWHEDQVVNFADLPSPLVDGADLRAEQKADVIRAHVPGVPGQLLLNGLVVPQAQQPVFLGDELFSDHVHPARVGEVSRGQYIDALDPGPGHKISGCEIFARSPGKFGMNVQVGNESIHVVSWESFRVRKKERSWTMTALVPPAGTLARSIKVPFWAASLRAMARPRPEPTALLVTNGSKHLSIISGARPGPLSTMARVLVFCSKASEMLTFGSLYFQVLARH